MKRDQLNCSAPHCRQSEGIPLIVTMSKSFAGKFNFVVEFPFTMSLVIVCPNGVCPVYLNSPNCFIILVYILSDNVYVSIVVYNLSLKTDSNKKD